MIWALIYRGCSLDYQSIHMWTGDSHLMLITEQLNGTFPILISIGIFLRGLDRNMRTVNSSKHIKEFRDFSKSIACFLHSYTTRPLYNSRRYFIYLCCSYSCNAQVKKNFFQHQTYPPLTESSPDNPIGKIMRIYIQFICNYDVVRISFYWSKEILYYIQSVIKST